jgi:hypothetical protein
VSLDVGGLQVVAGVRLGFGGGRARPPAGPALPGPLVAPPQPRRPPEAPRGVLVSTAHAYLLPDASREPLRTLPVGTLVKILDQSGEWVRVEFPDPQFGPRVGYVLRKHVQVSK